MINLERQGDYLFLDQKLALLIPSGATFEPETAGNRRNIRCIKRDSLCYDRRWGGENT